MLELWHRILSQGNVSRAYQQYVPVRYQRPGCGCGGGCGCLLLILLMFLALQFFSCIPNWVMPPEYVENPWPGQGNPNVLRQETPGVFETEQERINRERRRIERERIQLERGEQQLDRDRRRLEQETSGNGRSEY